MKLALSEIPKTGFVASRPILYPVWANEHVQLLC